MQMLNSVKLLLKGNKVRSQYDKLEAAIRSKANLMSQFEFHKAMEHFYSARVDETNPNEDWWGFADAKEKQFDHNRDLRHLSNKIVEADAIVQARKEAYETAKREHEEWAARVEDEPSAD